MNIEIKLVSSLEEKKIANRIAQYGFENTPSDISFKQRMAREKFREDNVQLILKENDIAMATSSIYPLTQNLRDRIIDCGGVAVIATLPRGRRKGHVTHLMQDMFIRMKKQKQAVSVLHPFKESYYYRFGYICLKNRIQIELKPQDLSQVLQMDIEGEFEVTSTKQNLNRFFSYLKTLQKEKLGMIMFTRKKFEEINENPHWIVFAKQDSEIVGAFLYKISMTQSKLIGKRLYYSTPMGKYILLRFLALHIDQVKVISLDINPHDDLFSQLLDIDLSVSRKIGAMGRIIDLQGLTNIKVGTGQVLLKISDDYCRWNNGNWRFRSDNGNLKVDKVQEKPLSTLNIQGLAAVVYGFSSLDEFEILSYGAIHPQDSESIKQLFPPRHHFIGQFF